MGNINQYTNLGFASVCIQVYISHIINWLGYIIYVAVSRYIRHVISQDPAYTGVESDE